jgi:hypothetical protein
MMKKTSNAKRRTSNERKCRGPTRTAISEFEIGRWAFNARPAQAVGRLLF